MFLQMLVSMSKKRNIIILSAVVLAAAVGLISIFFSDIRLFSKDKESFTFTAAGDYGYNTNTDRVMKKNGARMSKNASARICLSNFSRAIMKATDKTV